MIDPQVDKVLRDVCLQIEDRYPLMFLEIGTDEDYVHFLLESVSKYTSYKTGKDHQEHNGARDISLMP